MKRLWLVVVLLVAALPAWAHVGSKDVFQTVNAGPYVLYVTVRPPNVIPGVATVEVRSSGATVTGLQVTPLPLTGEASKHPPAADVMTASSADPAFYTGSVWMMATGTWQVKFAIEGAGGTQVASVPVLAVPVQTLKMEKGMGTVLSLMALFLIVSMAGIVAASIREARLRPGVEAAPKNRRNGWIAAGVSLAVMVLMVLLGGKWWNVEARDYAENVFVPATTTATLKGDQLDLHVNQFMADTSRRHRGNDDYLPDHGKRMHLYAIREPGMDAVFHLHPTLVSPGDFRLALPAMPAGHYKLYGDVVHATGFPETLLAEVDVPATMSGPKLDGEDASAFPAPLSQGELGTSYKLPDGYTMVWDAPPALAASTAYTFHFRLLDPAGKPATDMQPYLGMAGHAAFVKTDGTVFAHTHPEGSAAMADVMLASESVGSGMDMAPEKISPEVSFPYGFPTPGRYRIFVQMKHAGTVETGAFDAEVK